MTQSRCSPLWKNDPASKGKELVISSTGQIIVHATSFDCYLGSFKLSQGSKIKTNSEEPHRVPNFGKKKKVKRSKAGREQKATIKIVKPF
jgi:hypothetical protein